MDGLSVVGPQMNEALILPNKDGIEEVKAITNDFSAEYGRGNGAVAIITKSGTNRIHGSLFDDIRNEALNANTFANNVLHLPKTPFKVNYFGGTIGGPIKKDKLFYFAGFEGLTHHTGAQWLETVPTALEKKGDFSATLVDNNGVPTPLQLFDPFTATQLAPNLYQHAPIPNAIIANPNAAALTLYSGYPLPNRTPSDVYNDQNYFFQGIQTTRKDDANGRIDFYHGRQSIYGTGGIHDGQILTPHPWGPNNPYYIPPNAVSIAPVVSDRNPYVGIGDTIIINPNMVADMRVGLQRINTEYISQLYPKYDYNSAGVPPSIQALFILPGAAPNVYGYNRWSNLNATNAMHKYVYMSDWTTAGSLTTVRGKWTFKQGVEYRANIYSDPNIYEGSVGIYSAQNYSAEYTDAFGNQTPQDTISPIQGFGETGLLLGAGYLGITPGQSVQPLYDEKYYALYSQNDWRATPRLTINLGLRWDVQPAATERYDRVSSVDTTVNNIWGTPGVIAFPGVNHYGRNLWNVKYTDLGPRLGAAYKITDTLVARGGWGIIYTPSNSGLLHGPFNFGSAPFSFYLNDIPYGTNPAGVPIGTFSDPAISIPTNKAGADPTAPQNYGNGINLFPKYGYLDGRVQQWNVFIEKSFRGGWIVSGGYIGTRGANLPVSRQQMAGTYTMGTSYWSCYRSGVNCPAADSDLTTSGGYIKTGHDPANDKVPNPWNPNGTIPFGGALASATIPRYIRDSQYPMFYNDSEAQTYGFSSYRALQFEVRHSFNYGLTLDANYVWSRDMNFGGAEAPLSEGASGVSGGGVGFTSDLRWFLNPRRNNHLSYDNIPNRVVISGVYELPFGAGKHFNTDNRGARVIVSGWKLGGASVLQSGFPTPIGGGDSGSMNNLPNRVPGEPLQVPKALQHWYNGSTTVTLPDGRQITPCANCFLQYNVDAFSSPVIPNPTTPGAYINDNYWLGNAAITYGSITGPHWMNLDLNISRTFRITERVALDFAAMATNALNHNEPGNQIASGFAYNSTGLGGVNVVAPSASNNFAQLGQPTGSSSYGTYGLGTYDPRQVEIDLNVRF